MPPGISRIRRIMRPASYRSLAATGPEAGPPGGRPTRRATVPVGTDSSRNPRDPIPRRPGPAFWESIHEALIRNPFLRERPTEHASERVRQRPRVPRSRPKAAHAPPFPCGTDSSPNPRDPVPRRPGAAFWELIHEALIRNPFLWERWSSVDAPPRCFDDRPISGPVFNTHVSRATVPPALSIWTSFARLLLDSRHRLGMSQATLSQLAHVSRGQIAKIELGHADPSLDTAERLALALGLEVSLVSRPPILLEARQRDVVHAACSGYADRRLRAERWDTAREVEIIHGRSRGWIDLLAFDPRTGLLLVVEIKTRLDDIGVVERQLAWYERSAFDVAHRLGWPARRVGVWLLGLASAEVDAAIWANRTTLSLAFPVRAAEMATITTGGVWPKDHCRGLALIDPRSRRRDWLIRCRADGRRSVAPYVDYADAARRLAPVRNPESPHPSRRTSARRTQGVRDGTEYERVPRERGPRRHGCAVWASVHEGLIRNPFCQERSR